jgi:hypothetical protein
MPSIRLIGVRRVGAGLPSNIQNLISRPMDDIELKESLPRGVKIVRYKNLSKYPTIYSLLPKSPSAAIVLYENKPKDGHWCALARNDKGLFFFDPYGEMPDKQLEYAEFSRARVLHGGDKSISDLLATFKGPIAYNPHDYQAESPDVATCGRHSVNFIREIYGGGTLDTYYDRMKNAESKTGLSADQLVTAAVPTAN